MRYLLIDLHLQKGDYNIAQNLLDDLDGDFNLDRKQEADYFNLNTCYDIHLDALENNLAVITNGQEATLHSIADEANGTAAGYAQMLLQVYAGATYHEPLVDPALFQKNLKAWGGKKPPINEATKLSIYPNPADKHLILELGEETQVQSYEILNAMGSQVLSKSIKENAKLHFIDVSELATGNYLIRLQFANGEQHIEKLSIK